MNTHLGLSLNSIGNTRSDLYPAMDTTQKKTWWGRDVLLMLPMELRLT